MTPTFSVVVPCFGHERFVTAAIGSVWAQTFDDFEIVAVDDGSPDGTGAVLDAMAATSPRPMHVIHGDNRGASSALNEGAAAATAGYLAFLNDDDLFHPDRLDVFHRVIEKVDSFAWGFSGVEPIDEDGTPLPISRIPDAARRDAMYRSRITPEALRVLPRENIVISSGNLVVDRDLFRDLGGFRDLRFTHDWELAVRLLDNKAPFVVERQLYRYRVHPGNEFDRANSRAGTAAAATESELVLREHQEREAARSRSAAFGGTPWAQIGSLDPDSEFAVRGTLWALGKVRTVRPAYGALRKSAQLLRNLRRWWIER